LTGRISNTKFATGFIIQNFKKNAPSQYSENIWNL